MKIIILGPQASGKGTQAKLLVKKLGCHYFESGDVLREKAKESTPLGKKINQIINQKGTLVPDEMMKKIVETWLNKVDFSQGIIFDGYPRNLSQYQLLEVMLAKKGTKIDLVFFLKVSREVSIKRMAARRICSQCNFEYNLVTRPPKKAGLCDRCGQKLIQRQDDTPAMIEKRLATYEQLTRPLIDFVRQQGILEEVDGERSIEAIHQEMVTRLALPK